MLLATNSWLAVDVFADRPEKDGPSVQQAAASLVTQDGVVVTIAAHEPDVIDPVAIRFDCRGQMWVVEMRDYPTGPINGDDFNGRIKVLKDEDQRRCLRNIDLVCRWPDFPHRSAALA